jgi:hypothetical protein
MISHNQLNTILRIGWSRYLLFFLFTITALITVSVSIQVDPNHFLTWHDQQRMGQIALLTIAITGSATYWRQDLITMLTCVPNWVAWSWFCGFSIGLISVTLSAYPRFAMIEWTSFLMLLWLTLLWGGQIYKTDALDKWIPRLVMATAVLIAVKIMASYMGSVLPGIKLDSTILFTESFSNRRFFGQIASILIPLLAYPLLNIQLSRLKRISIFLLLSTWWMLAIASGTRGTWLALFVAASLLTVGAWRSSLPWLKLQIKALLLGIILFAVLFFWVPYLLQMNAAIENRLPDITSLSERNIVWSIAVTQIEAHPLLGIGPMHLASIRNIIAAHPHNAALQLMAEWGIPASIALSMPLIFGLISLQRRVRNLSEGEASLLVCLLAALLAATTQSMVDGVIVMPYTQLWLVMTGGWTLGAYYKTMPQKPNFEISSHLRWLVPIISIVGLGLLLASISPEIMNWHESIQHYVDEGSFLPPRYWVRGWIPAGQ